MGLQAKKITATLLGLIPIALVGVVGVVFLLSPAQRTPDWLTLSPLKSLPEDGSPVRLVISAPHRDAWTRLPDQFVGAVYARRILGKREAVVLSATHGKFGVQVNYDAANDCFESQCFVVRFNALGKVLTDDTVKMSQYEDLKAFSSEVVGENVLVQYSTQQ